MYIKDSYLFRTGVMAMAHITLRIIYELYCNLSNTEIERRKPWEQILP
jgi:hypothetical protein